MLSIAFLVAASSVADQMAPAKQGMVQCQSPDVLFKTCDSLSKVSQIGPDLYRIESEMLVDPDGPVVITEISTVSVQGIQVCDTVRLAEIDQWDVKVAGVPTTAAQAARHRSRIKRQLAFLSGQSICTTVVPGEQNMHNVQATIGGRRVPAFDYAMKWVSPDEGWKVAP